MSGPSALLDQVRLPSADPFEAPDMLSPEGIHEYLLRAHRISNELRYKFLGGLRALDEGRFFSSLGFPTMWAYAEHFFGWEKSRTYEALRVARALEDLPLTRDRFIAGLAYSRVLEITRIASRETEAEWIAFAEKTTLKRLRLEVSDAKGKGRRVSWAPFRAANHGPCRSQQACRRAYRGQIAARGASPSTSPPTSSRS